MRLFTKMLLLFSTIAMTSCATHKYKGNIAKITNVPRSIIIREKTLLTKRINIWARSLDKQLKENKTDNPLGDDTAFAIRARISRGTTVLDMFNKKMLAPGAISFTRKEWGMAEQANCKIERASQPGKQTFY